MANEKISDAQIRMMREYRKAGWTHKDLAFFFGMSEGRCSEICRGKARVSAGGPIEETPTTGRSMDGRRGEVLDDEKAEYIKDLRLQGFSHSEIAVEVSVSKSLVGAVLRGETRFG